MLKLGTTLLRNAPKIGGPDYTKPDPIIMLGDKLIFPQCLMVNQNTVTDYSSYGTLQQIALKYPPIVKTDAEAIQRGLTTGVYYTGGKYICVFRSSSDTKIVPHYYGEIKTKSSSISGRITLGLASTIVNDSGFTFTWLGIGTVASDVDNTWKSIIGAGIVYNIVANTNYSFVINGLVGDLDERNVMVYLHYYN